MIEVVNQHPTLRVSMRELSKLCRLVAEGEKRQVGEISIILITDRKIAKVHREFLNDPTTTDVITFDLGFNEELSGDIMISLDTAFKQAKEFDVTLKQETGRLAVHGMLHLCGMLDDTPRRRNAMHKRENKYLALAGWIE